MAPDKNRITPETIAENYRRDFEPAFAAPVSRELFRIANLRSGERVLDVACGTGYVARAAAKIVGPVNKVAGVDIAPNMIAVARASAPDIEWHVADAEELPFADATFDAVLCQMGLMFVKNRDRAVAEMHRVLDNDGRAVISTPGAIQPIFEHLKMSVAENIDAKLGMFVQAVFSMNEPEMLAELFNKAGFADVSTRRTEVMLHLQKPSVFFWKYTNMTPMGPAAEQSPAEQRAAAEEQFVTACEPFLSDGELVFKQPMLTTSGRKRA